MKIKGHVIITHSQRGSGRPDCPHQLTVQDAKSGVEFVSVEMTDEQFCGMLTGFYQPVEIDVAGLECVGTKHEVRVVEIPAEDIGTANPAFRKWWKKHVLPLETDGWKAEDTGYNHHMYTAVGKYKVHFHRYVADRKVVS